MSGNTNHTRPEPLHQGLLDHDLAYIGSWVKELTNRNETHDISSSRMDFSDVSSPPRAPMAKETQQSEDEMKASNQDDSLVRWQLESTKESSWTVGQVASSQVQDKGQ